MSIFTGSHPSLVQPNIFKSEIKNKLGFSIDSIVGRPEVRSSPPVSPVSPRPVSPVSVKHSWSPGRSPPGRDRSRSPIRQRSVSPPASPPSSLYRPTPASLPASTSLAQSYLQDQLASLKAFYEAKGQSVPLPGSSPLLNPGLSLPAGLPGFPRPPSSLPPFLGLPPIQPPPVPRELPIHPWFINRHRFPLGKLTTLTLIFSTGDILSGIERPPLRSGGRDWIIPSPSPALL